MDTDDRLAALEHRIARLEDKDQIAELVVRYGDAVDAHDVPALRALFSDDARWAWANGLGEGVGIDAVIELLTGRFHTIDASLHVSHGHVIELDDDDADRATGVLFSHAEVTREGTPMISALRYDDAYRRVDGTWRFAERVLSFYYYVNAETYVGDLVSGTPVRAGETPMPADIPRRR